MKIEFVLCLFLAFTEPCPYNCKCSKYKIFCKDSQMGSLPEGLPTTQTVSMDGDILEHLNASFFISNHGLRNLTNLVLINLQIQDIQNSTFATLRNLESLTIKYNILSELSAGAFQGLGKLYLLDLSDNNLKTLPAGIFDGLWTLRHLNLRFNKIRHLQHQMFWGLSRDEDCRNGGSLKSIDIAGNPLRTISGESNLSFSCVRKFTIQPVPILFHYVPLTIFQNFNSLQSIEGILYRLDSNTLRGLNQLTHINISYSNIQTIPHKFLPDSHNLKSLWLRRSYIKHLHSNCFHGLFHLLNLNLHRNKLNFLEDNIFQELLDLKYLTLSENYLTSINKNTFRGLVKLRYLNLDSNRLTFLQRNTFSHMPELRELILARNEFNNFHFQAFSNLSFLKILRVPIDINCTMINVTLETMQRLDILEGSICFEMNVQVLNSFKLKLAFSSVPNDFQKYLKGITYLSNPITLEIVNLEASESLNFLSGITISSLIIESHIMFVLKNYSFLSLPKLKSLTINSFDNIVIQQHGLKNLACLEDLTLRFHNFLPEFANGIFKSLNNLKRLFMFSHSYGEQNIFTRQTFDGLKNIQLLVIAGFNITTLSSNFFNLQTLDNIFLFDNKVCEVSRGAFLGLKNLRGLDLGENCISNIGPGIFGAICDEDFTLTCGNLTYLSKYCNTSYALENLEYLNLQKNISFIHHQAFLGCNKLQSLVLSYNQIETLDFLYLPQLQIIRIEDSIIYNLSNTTFKCTPELVDVSFDNSYVIGMELSTFKHLIYLKYLFLPNSICDCNYRNIWKWMRNRNIVYRHSKTMFSQHLINDQLNKCNFIDVDVYLSQLECNSSSDPKYYNSKNTTSNSNKLYYFKTYVEPVVLILIFVSGSFGNGLLLYVIFSHSALRNKHNACIVQLAFADILSLTLNIALSYWDVMNDTWKLSETTCKVFVMSKDLVVYLVVFTVLALTLERFVVVRTSFKLKSIYGFRDLGPTLLLVTVWIYSLVINIPSCISATLYKRCLPSPPGTDYEIKIITFHLMVISLIPVVFTISLNIATAYMLKKSNDKVPGEFRNETRGNRRNSVANIVTVLSIVFTVSYLPNFVLRTLVLWFSWSVWTYEDIFWYSFVSYCLFFLHTIFNRFAIFVMGSKFRAQFMRLFSIEKTIVPEIPDIQQSIKNPCNFLLNLGEGIAGTRKENHGELPTFPHDSAKHDEAVRRARQERLKKIQERFSLKF